MYVSVCVRVCFCLFVCLRVFAEVFPSLLLLDSFSFDNSFTFYWLGSLCFKLLPIGLNDPAHENFKII